VTRVLLIYPFFVPKRDRSVFRFPPLGLTYLAASLREAEHDVHLIDCTFLSREAALLQALAIHAEVVGIYGMVSMLDECLWFAAHLRPHCQLLVAGGPLPSCDPGPFLEGFDVVVRGEGEQTMLELLRAQAQGLGLADVPGLVFRRASAGNTESSLAYTPDRPFIQDLDAVPFPARDLLPNNDYIAYTRRKYGYSITTVMSTRGCPFRCEFCSNVVFGGSFRKRSPANVVDEVEQALSLGYERISFADDVFTMHKERVVAICREIRRRGLDFRWECLGRVDAIDFDTATEMRLAGCTRIYFGIESGSDEILERMNKKISTDEALRAVEAARRAGLQVGAFFILCYPGDTDDTVLKTLHFATRLPLDYLGLSMPYPLPGTQLYDRTRDQITRTWRPDAARFGGHVVIFEGGFSEAKMWFAMLKGRLQFEIRRRAGPLASLLMTLIERPSDAVFRLMR
jgi:anaerobic magnesium-protoporphyrin IX monomethyl ester cyclase